MKKIHSALLASIMLATAAFPITAQADSYPEKPVSIIVSYPPGGDSDALARMFAEKFSQYFDEPFVVENRPGAGGTIGNSLVERSSPDGYTILFTPNPFTTAPMVMGLGDSSYDVLNGFDPVILTNRQSVLLVANPSTDIEFISDLVSKGKAGDSLNYASPGAGSPMHIAAEWLNNEAGINIQHIPYRGIGPMIPDILAGHVDMGWVTYGPVSQLLESGRLNAVAISDPERSPIIPNVPTISESGYPNVKLGAWHGFMAPKGTPTEIIEKLNKAANEIINNQDVINQMAMFGAVPVGGAPDALAEINLSDYETLSAVINELGISAE